ncbi:MAG: ThiF family adenylyltransferase [Candidatus Scatosoma sp.]
MERFCRAKPLLTEEGAEKLKNAKVLLFGVGGVGGYVAEALIRCGLGRLDVVDGDKVALSNINRQIVALTSTLGRYKAEAFAERAKDVNPQAQVIARNVFFNGETADSFDFSAYDYVVDAVDDVAAKTEIVVRATAAKVPVISAMGAGNKMNPTLFKVADISETSVCPLARVMRKKLKERGVTHCKAVFSTEKITVNNAPPASVAFVPSVAGLIIAGEVVRDLCGVKAGVPAI